jgi:hypothetical protein
MNRLLLFVAIGGFFMPGFARQDTTYAKRAYIAYEVTVPPVIDGWFNDTAWNAVPWEGGFQMYEPYDDRPATQDTRFKVVFDRENIYVAIRAFDTAPDSIVRRLTRRDEIDGDMVAFQFDSHHDLQTAYTFFVSAAGSKMDAYETDDGDNMDETWNAIWWVKTQVDDQGWTMEAKIPFSQLRFDRSSGGVWGFQLARDIFRKSETSLWQPMSRESPGWVHLLGELQGLENIDPKKQAEIIPYAVGGSQWFEKDPEDPFREEGYDRIFNAGLDAKVGITSNFTLDMTLNPDFGQVEADPSVVNLTAFETFFQEQRPFFIEGNNIFDFDLALFNMSNLFYSRRIGRRPQLDPSLEEGEYARIPEFTNILGAAKITGKTKDGLSVGIMESVTAAEKAEIDLNGERRLETLEPLTNYFASRVSKEFDKGNTQLGGMVTSTNRLINEPQLETLHGSAITGGIDFQQYFRERNYVLSLSGYMSQVSGSKEALVNTQQSPARYYQRPDADYVALDSSRTSLAGYGGGVQFGKQSGKFQFMGLLSFNSPGLELNDIGFLTSADEIVQVFWMGYRLNEPFSIFRSAGLNLNQWNGWDFGGRHQVLGLNVNGNAEFNNLWHARFYADTESEIHTNSALRGGPTLILPGGFSTSLSLSTSSRKKLMAEVDGFFFQGYEDSGTRYGVDLEFTYKPISNLNLSVYPEFSHRKSELQYVDQQHFENEDRYIFGSIDQKTLSMSFRLNLTLTPELTIQYWGQPFIASGDYTDFKYITDPKADKFRDRFLAYKPGEIDFVEEGVDEAFYKVTEPGSSLEYEFENPSFNIKEFLSNLVFRWEYRPGSFVYLVWSQSRSGYDPLGNFRFGNDFSDIWDIHPTDVLLLKVSYRIGR